MDWRDRIAVDPDVVFGKPRIKGTRLSVEFLMGLFGAGWSEQQVLESYPQLAREDLQALFALAAEMIAEEGFVIAGKLAA
ncbi:hypothetical protein GCM10009105_30190 [Dokdonella soli]|uniref:DUF433 domain-containing protein n=1 Tax=Dokdonella soli TaxID=529810 RepID=A0ABP3U1Y5_9GAMM